MSVALIEIVDLLQSLERLRSGACEHDLDWEIGIVRGLIEERDRVPLAGPEAGPSSPEGETDRKRSQARDRKRRQRDKGRDIERDKVRDMSRVTERDIPSPCTPSPFSNPSAPKEKKEKAAESAPARESVTPSVTLPVTQGVTWARDMGVTISPVGEVARFDAVSEAIARELMGGYAERFRARAKREPPPHAQSYQHRLETARVLVRQAQREGADPSEFAKRWLDAAFAVERWEAARWPWKWLSEDPIGVLEGASSKSGDAAKAAEKAKYEELANARNRARERGDEAGAEEYDRQIAALARRAPAGARDESGGARKASSG